MWDKTVAPVRPPALRPDLAWRLGLTAALGGALYALIACQQAFRGWEVAAASRVVAVGASTTTMHDTADASLAFGLDTALPMGLRITAECTSAFLLVPFVLFTLGTVWLRRPKIVLRALMILPIVTVLVLAANQVRILLIVWLIQGMGPQPGYHWGHTLFGSLVSIVGLAVGLTLFTFVISGRSLRRR